MIHVVRESHYGAGIYCRKLAEADDLVVPLSDGVLNAFRAVYKCRNLHKYIVFHGYGLAIYLFFLRLFFYRKFTWVYFCHSYEWEIKNGITKIAHISFLKYMINSCSIVFSIHDKLNKYCDNYCKMENFLNVADFTASDEQKYRFISERVNAKRIGSKNLIMLVGRNVALKNFKFAADAFSEFPDVVVIHFGDTEPIGPLRNVYHFGYVSNNILISVMKLFDCVCVPSLVEAAPTVTLEAISNGVNVIVSDIDAHSHVSEELKFDPRSKVSLISCFTNLTKQYATKDEKKHSLGSTSRTEMVERMNTWITRQS